MKFETSKLFKLLNLFITKNRFLSLCSNLHFNWGVTLIERSGKIIVRVSGQEEGSKIVRVSGQEGEHSDVTTLVLSVQTFALHLKNFPSVSIRYKGDTRVIPG